MSHASWMASRPESVTQQHRPTRSKQPLAAKKTPPASRLDISSACLFYSFNKQNKLNLPVSLIFLATTRFYITTRSFTFRRTSGNPIPPHVKVFFSIMLAVKFVWASFPSFVRTSFSHFLLTMVSPLSYVRLCETVVLKMVSAVTLSTLPVKSIAVFLFFFLFFGGWYFPHFVHCLLFFAVTSRYTPVLISLTSVAVTDLISLANQCPPPSDLATH